MSDSIYAISAFCNLPSRDRLPYLLQLISACTHEELVSIQAVLSQLFYRDFIAFLPHQLVVQILLKLSLKDTLACMLVSRAWYDVIMSDPCATIWKEQVKLFNPRCNICVESYQWKYLCRQARIFQLGMFDEKAYTVDTFNINKTMNTENIKIFELQNNSNYLVMHGLCLGNNGLYRDVVILWKYAGKEFEYKKNILEEIDTGSYVSPVETKFGSRIKMCLHSSFVFIIQSVYLCMFDLNTLSFTSRFPLPSMSEVMDVDCVCNSDNSLNLVIAFFDGSVHFINTSKGDTVNWFIVDVEIPFHFSLIEIPKLRMIVYSDFGFRLFEFSEDYSPITIPESLPRDSSYPGISFKLSNDRKYAAILKYNRIKTPVISKLFLFSTNSWELIYSQSMPPSYNIFSVTAVGRKYIVLVSDRVKLEFLICNYEQTTFLIKSVSFNGFSPHQETFSPSYVVAMLAIEWLDGEIFDNVFSVEKKGSRIPMFLVLSKSLSLTLNILYLNI